MCVIALAGLDPTMPQKRLTPDMVDRMFSQNSEGAGIAWREEGVVKWEKGLELDGIQALCAEVPLPYVAHFRISTCGGSRQDLCHPFPIDRNAPLFTTGHTKGYVLFHNGHWGEWKKEMKDIVRQSGFKVQIPSGKWSDSRAMAWAAAYYGNSVLEIIDEKAIVFGPEDYDVYGTGWVKEQEIWCSNNHWNWSQVGHHTMCRERTCTKPKFGAWDFCVGHMCTDANCHEARMENMVYCRKHQKGRGVDTADTTDVWDTEGGINGNGHSNGGFMGMGGKGGTSQERPFRTGGQDVSGGKDKQKEDKAGAEGSGKGGETDTDSKTLSLHDIKKWACSINSKDSKDKKINGTALAGAETDAERTKRLDDIKAEIIDLGRL